jgi:hypothetical protein
MNWANKLTSLLPSNIVILLSHSVHGLAHSDRAINHYLFDLQGKFSSGTSSIHMMANLTPVASLEHMPLYSAHRPPLT